VVDNKELKSEELQAERKNGTGRRGVLVFSEENATPALAFIREIEEN
jgi:hypothetical protein